MAKASISTAWDESKRVFATDSRALSAVALALLVLPSATLGTVAPQSLMGIAPTEIGPTLIAIAVMLIGLVGRVTIARIAIGPSAMLSSALAESARRALAAAGAFLLFMIPVALLMAPFIPAVLANPTDPPPAATVAFLLIFLVAFALGVRLLSMVIPAAADQGLGPIALLKRSWSLTRGHWWKLIGLLLLFFLASAVAVRAVGSVLGSILILVSGPIDPMTVSALLFALTLSLVSAAFIVLLWVMLGRIYVQLRGAAQAEAGVPTTGS